jgi:glycine/D-amino acid oxidase-like deaminating enzyme
MKVLVVGGGVAGICLTHELLQAECEVQLVDNGRNVSSSVAAGIINPIVFRRMTLSWRVSEFIPFAYHRYREMENQTGTSFFHPLVIRRLFASEQELEFWKKKQNLTEYSDYMETLTKEDLEFPLDQNTFGTARVKQASYIDAKSFIRANRNYFQSKNLLLEETFNHNELNAEEAVYKGTRYDFIVFAEGKFATATNKR